MDNYEGETENPQSLHSFLYADGNPINANDPSGLFSQKFGYAVEKKVQSLYRMLNPLSGNMVDFGSRQAAGSSYLKPDIFDRFKKTWAEIKPLSIFGVINAAFAWAKYSAAFPKFRPDSSFPPIPIPIFGMAQYPHKALIFNVQGIVFYTTIEDLKGQINEIKNRAKTVRDVFQMIQSGKFKNGMDAFRQMFQMVKSAANARTVQTQTIQAIQSLLRF